MADYALAAVPGLQIGMLAEKVRDFDLDRLGQQDTCPIAQDFGQLIVDVSGMLPFRFLSSPTFQESSKRMWFGT